ncbi:zinc-binding dehydrogenase [Sphingomonas sp. Leaf25]|nr:zinc-binding dehydrogenase [Sphingomonas sp. Leaf25]
MKAIRFYGQHDVRLDEIDGDLDPGSGEVLIAPTLIGICGTDLHEFESGPIFIPRTPHPYGGAQLPQIIGHEFSAKVVRCGPGVVGLREGQRVSIQPQLGAKNDYFGSRDLCFLGKQSAVVGLTWKWGGMAERAIVPDYCCIPMPDDVTDVQGAMVEPTACAVHAIDRASVRPGSSVLITGAGSIGALATMAAKAAGATRIIVSEVNPNRRRRIEQLAIATAVLDPRSPDFGETVRSFTQEGVGVDAAIECSGNRAAFQNCLDQLRPQGIMVQVGLSGEPFTINTFDLTMRDITLRGSLNYELSMWPRIFEMMRSGLLPAEKLMDDIIPMKDIVEGGFNRLTDPEGASMKILVGVD